MTKPASQDAGFVFSGRAGPPASTLDRLLRPVMVNDRLTPWC